MRHSIFICLILISATAIGSALFHDHDVEAVDKDRRVDGFNERSLNGSYASGGRAGGFQSRSVGVAKFDGRGNATRYVKINSRDGMGGRRFLFLTSVGTYTIQPDGVGVIYFTNFFEDGRTSEVTYDFVVRKSSKGPARKGLLADEMDAVQQEAGVTAELVEESFCRRDGIR